MTEGVKVKSASTTRRNRSGKNREYLFGSLDAFNTDWADKVVDLKIDVDELNKYRSLSTNDNFSSHHQSITSDGSDLRNQSIVSDAGNVNLTETTDCQGCVQLQKELRDLKDGSKTSLLYSDCEKRIEKLRADTKDMELKDKIEHLLNEIYTITSEVFGEDNAISLYLEEYANLYLTYQNNVQMELTGLKSQLEVVNSFDKILNDKVNYSEVIQQKVKIIDSLVEQLKDSKDETNIQVSKVKDELERVRVELENSMKLLNEKDEKLDEYKKLLLESRKNFLNLLSDQRELLSQIPLATSKIGGGPQKYDVHQTSHQYQRDSLLQGQKESKHVLDGLVTSLYNKNYEYLRLIGERDNVIQQQQLTIQRLQQTIKEWENDGVLWLDYVDQTKNILNN